MGNRLGRHNVFGYGALTLSGDPFQRPSPNNHTFSLPDRPADRNEPSHNPEHTTPAGYHMRSV